MNTEQLKELLIYNPVTGIFTQKKRTSQRVHVGDVAGYKNDSGYIIICIRGKDYRAHRLAWLWIYGEMPANEIDHINGVRDDNRIVNLRNATRKENAQNIREPRIDSELQLKGVRYRKRTGKFYAQIVTDRKCKYLGCFNTAEAAHNAYLMAKRELHSLCTI